MRGLFNIIVIFLLLSCSSETDLNKIKKIKDLYYSDKTKTERTLTRKIIDSFDYPLIMIETNGLIQKTLMLPISKRDGFHNYISGSGQGLTLDGANIIRSFGMNANLLSMNIKGINIYSQSTPLKEWPSEITKIYRFVTPSFKEKTIEFVCKLNQKEKEKIIIVEKIFLLTKLTEDCISNDLNFQNTYWTNNEGFIWKSIQWISLSNTFAEISILKT